MAIQPEHFDEHACVVVSWSGATGDLSNDWVSSWWEPYAATYIQYFDVLPLTETNSTCFSLHNARHGYRFRYYRGNTLLATSNAVQPNGAYPMHVRVTFVGNEADKLRVHWISNRSAATDPAVTPVVRYGVSPHQLDRVAYANVTTFTHADINTLVGLPHIPIRKAPFDDIASRFLRCGNSFPTNEPCFTDRTACEQFVDPGQLHYAEITDLIPGGTTYYYQVGELSGPVSKVLYVKSPWALGQKVHRRTATLNVDDAISVLLMADGGFGMAREGFRGGALDNKHKTNGFDQVVTAITTHYARKSHGLVTDDFHIFNGDLSYAQGWPYAWEHFHTLTSPIYAHVPIVAGYGNHEVDWGHNPVNDFELRGSDSGGECGLVAAKRFHIANPWYLTTYGPLCVITLSSEHNITVQADYLRQLLPTLDRRAETGCPWLVVQIHRPLYTSCFIEITSMVNRYTLVDLFITYNVDLVYTGHVHFYERTCQISNDVCADWGFRDVWTSLGAVQLSPASMVRCAMNTTYEVFDLPSCRMHCARQGRNATRPCVGVMHEGLLFKCTLLACLDDLIPAAWNLTSMHTMSMESGMPPLYIVDGVAGAEPEPSWTFKSSLTEYKDFVEWGYSRLVVNATQLSFFHYHMDGLVHDSQVLTK